MTTAQSHLQTKIKSKNACSDMFHTDYIIYNMCMWESARHVWQITLQGCFGKKLRHWWGVWVVVGKTALASWGSWWGYSIRAVRGRRRASCGGIPLRSMCAVCVVDVPSAPSICRILPLTSLGVAGGDIGLCMQ